MCGLVQKVHPDRTRGDAGVGGTGGHVGAQARARATHDAGCRALAGMSSCSTFRGTPTTDTTRCTAMRSTPYHLLTNTAMLHRSMPAHTRVGCRARAAAAHARPPTHAASNLSTHPVGQATGRLGGSRALRLRQHPAPTNPLRHRERRALRIVQRRPRRRLPSVMYTVPAHFRSRYGSLRRSNRALGARRSPARRDQPPASPHAFRHPHHRSHHRETQALHCTTPSVNGPARCTAPQTRLRRAAPAPRRPPTSWKAHVTRRTGGSRNDARSASHRGRSAAAARGCALGAHHRRGACTVAWSTESRTGARQAGVACVLHYEAVVHRHPSDA